MQLTSIIMKLDPLGFVSNLESIVVIWYLDLIVIISWELIQLWLISYDREWKQHQLFWNEIHYALRWILKSFSMIITGILEF